MTNRETDSTDRTTVTPPLSCNAMTCDYFRMAPHLWPTMLARLCQLGADVVCVSVPWAWHQPEEKWVDLTGITHPQRDLIGFIQLCARMQLSVHLSLELLPEAGLIAWGIPMWLLQQFPESQAVLPNREPEVFPLPSLEHPTYTEHVLRWLQTLSDPLLELQSATEPITAVHLAALPDRDYNAHNARVLWPIWLRQHYDGIGHLNAAWGTNYETFNAIMLHEHSLSPTPSAKNLPQEEVKDFFAWVDTRWFNRRAEWLSKRGWQIPVVGPTAPIDSLSTSPHVAQIAEDLPTLAVGVAWAETAPVASDGQPSPTFWTVKAKSWAGSLAESDEKVFAVVREQNSRVRLPAPAGKTVILRLLLNGRLLPIKHRLSRGKLVFDYQLVDASGFTDMYLVHPESAPLTNQLTTYLQRLLSVREAALDYTSRLCQDLASALVGSSSDGGNSPPPGSDTLPKTAQAELLEAERSLENARLAVLKATASLGEIERRLSPVIPGSLYHAGTWMDLSVLTPNQRSLLAELADDFLSYAAQMREARDTAAVHYVQSMEPDNYAAVWEVLGAPVEPIRTSTLGWIAKLRIELNSGGLPPVVWTVHNLLEQILRGLTNL